MRKTPQQVRAQDTIDVIFEATARILERDGRAGLNTNAIAQLAGISVGTLYHYFPGKEAILIAMARRELEQHTSTIVDALGALQERGGDALNEVVRSLILAFRTRPAARQAAAETLIANNLGHELAYPAQAVAQRLGVVGKQFLDVRAESLSPVRLFILTRAVSGVLNAAARERSPLLDTPEFERELVGLVRALLFIS
jgi:AcrR family transcriptional regulator